MAVHIGSWNVLDDVLCLQEVDSALFTLAENALTGFVGHLLTTRGHREGCAIFVRRTIAPEPEWKELTSDQSTHVALGMTVNGTTVVSTHLKWVPDGTAAASLPSDTQPSDHLAIKARLEPMKS